MRVQAEIGKCEGYANCVVAAPEVFSLDDDYLVVVDAETPAQEQRAAVEEAVRSCPAAALALQDD